MKHRDALAPQMAEYTDRLYDRGTFRWLPYLMYFHPANHRSEVVNTDSLGFRFTPGPDANAAPGGWLPSGPVNLLVGSSVVFGVGATNDAATLSSRLWSAHTPDQPWLNFGGRSHNSVQELLLYTLYRHLVPEVGRIVVFSGFNNLGLARLPQSKQGDHGAFYLCNQYFEKIDELKEPLPAPPPDDTEDEPGIDEQISNAAELTLRHLDGWRLLADGLGAELSFVLQPLAPWVRNRPAPEEKRLFDELDALFDFTGTYGDIVAADVGRAYAKALQAGCERARVPFVDMNCVLGEALRPDDWVFVDRAHFTDAGYDLVARLLVERLDLI